MPRKELLVAGFRCVVGSPPLAAATEGSLLLGRLLAS